MAVPVAIGRRRPYSPPRTPWGDPDLQAIWSGDSAFGIPLQRPAGARHQGRAHRRGVRREGAARRAHAHDRRERRRLVPQRQLVADAFVPADVAHRRSAGRPHAGARAGRRGPAHAAGHLRQRSAQRPRGLHALRPLHHARRDRVDDAEDLRQRLPHRAGAGLRRDHGGDDSRGARDPARRPAARRRRRPRVPRRLARPLGRQHAGHRDHQLQRQGDGAGQSRAREHRAEDRRAHHARRARICCVTRRR